MCPAAGPYPAAASRAPTTTRSRLPDTRPMSQVDFIVNGQPVKVETANEDVSLLTVLRTNLGLVGTRFGCGLEQCGCCTVLIEGKAEKSCARPAATVAGKSVVTVEGLG